MQHSCKTFTKLIVRIIIKTEIEQFPKFGPLNFIYVLRSLHFQAALKIEVNFLKLLENVFSTLLAFAPNNIRI